MIINPESGYKDIEEKTNKKELREVLTVPKCDFPINNEISIYQDKLAIRSYSDDKLVVVICSQQIADTQRAIFNLLWKLLKKNKI